MGGASERIEEGIMLLFISYFQPPCISSLSSNLYMIQQHQVEMCKLGHQNHIRVNVNVKSRAGNARFPMSPVMLHYILNSVPQHDREGERETKAKC